MIAKEQDSRFYWLWLQSFLGIGSCKLSEVLEHFKTPKAVFESSKDELVASGIFSKTDFSRKEKIVYKKLLESLKYCDQNNIRVVDFLSTEYPECLRLIENPPALLFVRGENLQNLFPSIAVVGSRKATDHGKKAAFSLSAKLSLAGLTIVSGGALGIDKMAHLGAISAGGKTVAVLGSGIDNDYLKENEGLRKSVEKHGAIVSEFLPKAPATKYTFPIRNRIISALSSGVVVVEAGAKSGALITATYAYEQGRDIFAVPGSIEVDECKGSNQLIKECATAITSFDDIISVYSGKFGDILKTNVFLTRQMTAPLYFELEREAQLNYEKGISTKGQKNKNTVEYMPLKDNGATEFVLPDLQNISCSDNARLVLSAFDAEVMVSDLLSSKSRLFGGEFIMAITELELKGFIKAVPVGRYKINLEKHS